MEVMETARRSPGWEPGRAGLRDRREGVTERTRLEETGGVFVHAFSPIAPAAQGGAQPGAFMAFMFSMVKIESPLCLCR